MVIDIGAKGSTHHICAGDECNVKLNELITTFYSAHHATKRGWHLTKHIQFCDPSLSHVWVCPECSKHWKWSD